MTVIIIIPAILILGFLLWILFRNPGEPSDDTDYSQTRNFMDFDSGLDDGKLGDPKYPNAGADSVMKHEFIEDLFKDEK